MSLEDQHLSNIMEDLKTKKIATNDVNYIDFRLHEQGLGKKHTEKRKDDELQRLLRLYPTRTEPTIIVTKGEPYRFVVQCNDNNSSGFETWRRLRVTYDQGEKHNSLAHYQKS
eukprot:6482251-Amphidinium_carterae.2